jgi:recombination protein RecT
MTDTKTKTEQPAVQVAEPAKKSQGLMAYEGFQAEIQNRADELASQLPSNVTRDRFINASIAAVKQTPGILAATPRSLFAALTKAAQDGLLPDGREGVITVYNQKVAVRGQPDRWEQVAQWNPMIYGLRKRARELDSIIIDTQVVFANDFFEREQGDDPKIVHKPAPLGEDQGKRLGAYAIYRHQTQGILHREVMSAAEIETTRQQSKAKDSLMWTKFWTEGWRKAVARRGIKSVPVSAALERLVQRDDDTFDFNSPRDITPQQLTPPEPPPAEEDPPLHNSDHPDGAKNEVDGFDMEALRLALAGAHTDDEVDAAFDEFDVPVALADDEVALQKAFDLKGEAHDRVNRPTETDGQGSML